MPRKDFSSMFYVGPRNYATVGWKKPLFESPKLLKKFCQINLELSTKNPKKTQKGFGLYQSQSRTHIMVKIS